MGKGARLRKQRMANRETVKDLLQIPDVPVVHGRWIDGPHGETMCNACGYECETGLLKEIAIAFEELPKYCPNCGAKMDLEG